MEEGKSKKSYILKEKKEKKMTVIVCTRNQELRDFMQKKEDIVVFFSGDTDIQVCEYDLVIVDIELCGSKLDVARLQSSRTVFIMPELTNKNLDKVLCNFKVGEHLFSYSFKGDTFTIDLNDVVYFESKHREVLAYFENGESVRFYGKLDDVQSRTEDYIFFLRVNKSCLVNYNHCEIRKHEVIISNRAVPVSRTYKEAFKKRMQIIQNM